MKTEKIKPVPMYILKKIQKADRLDFPKPSGLTRFYSYLTKNDGEIVSVTVAVKHYFKRFLYKQVAVKGLHSNQCFVKDVMYSYTGGYRVGWFDAGIAKYPKWFESDDWGYADDKYFNIFAPCINPEYLNNNRDFKYCALKLFDTGRVIDYLRIYEKFPQAEYLIKLGLKNYATSKTILKRIAKDKAFIKWLAKNRDELQSGDFYIPAVLNAYKTGRPISEQNLLFTLLSHTRSGRYSHYKNRFCGDWNQLLLYILKHKIDVPLYFDYYDACVFLNLDMALDKNLYPRDFKRRHDIRADEYSTAVAILEEKSRKLLYDDFKKMASKYISLQYSNAESQFLMVIAKSPAELIREGLLLHHCVGRMGYDQKMIRGESLIFFVRNRLAPDTPLATVEYSLSKRAVLQCHADSNNPPNSEIISFVHDLWLPYANRMLNAV